MQTLRERIEALPEPERSLRRGLFPDYKWNLPHDWELDAYSHQVPPSGDDWDSWTVIGGRRTGTTTAGVEWIVRKFLYGPPARFLAIDGHARSAVDMFTRIYDKLGEHGLLDALDIKYPTNNVGVFEDKGDRGRSLKVIVDRVDYHSVDYFRGSRYDYIWADEVEDATLCRHAFPHTEQFVFTQPTKIDPDTILSRAGAY